MKSTLILCFCLAILLSWAVQDSIQAKPQNAYNHEDNLIEIVFAKDLEVRLRGGQPTELSGKSLTGLQAVMGKANTVGWTRICDVPEERLDELETNGERRTGKDLFNMNNIYRLEIAPGQDIWAICEELESQDEIHLARPVPKPVPLPLPTDYEPSQGYLASSSSTPTGLGFGYAWTFTGGDGTSVAVCDLEYGWNYAHQDISQAPYSQINFNSPWIPSGFTDDHGTAVIGMLSSDPNGWGTTGVCNGATLMTCGTNYGAGWNVPGAMAIAMAALSAGDVMLLEQQWDYNSSGAYIPIEWWLDYYPSPQSHNSVYIAIENAVANGIHVVEAGGNGAVDTDALTWYGNSGAIIVGAGGVYPGGYYSEGDLERMSFSSYGSRFDLQGWGENVVTTGYNDLYSAEGKNLWYTAIFAGTSSSSPCIAGAVASCVGMWQGAGYRKDEISPSEMLQILKSTGSTQVFGPSGNIGPRPDLLNAFNLLQAPRPWSDASDNVTGYAGRSSGCAMEDFDNDGDLDLYVANDLGGANLMLRNDGVSGFTDISASPLNNNGEGRSAVCADYDNDGDIDIYLVNRGNPNVLFRNDGGMTFTPISGPIEDAGNGTTAAWGDYDNDGLLDLYLANDGANFLFKNMGSDTFTDVTAVPLNDAQYTTSCCWVDYDNDGDVDLFMGTYYGTGRNKLFRNDGSGVFVDVTTTALAGTGDVMGMGWADYDNDGDMDLYYAVPSAVDHLMRNDGGGVFTDVTPSPLDQGGYCATAWGDYNNDGLVDLYVGDAGPNHLFENHGGLSFYDIASAFLCPLDDMGSSGGAANGDFDGDGDIDLYLANFNGMNRLFENEMGNQNNWLHIDLVGSTSNRDGIGSIIKVYTNPIVQTQQLFGGSGYNSHNSLLAEFGLQTYATVDSVVVVWPSGTVTVQTGISANQVITINEAGSSYICGDANSDGSCNIADASYIINAIFFGGTQPNPIEAADANGDGSMNIADASYIINWIFFGGGAPICPT